MSKNPVLYKTLVVGVIVLFIGIGIQPAIAIIEPENTDESRVSDDYQEIITFIYGIGTINWIKRRGIFRGEIIQLVIGLDHLILVKK